MDIILMDDVVGLGDIGEQVTVRPGYARNYLIPRGLAVETGARSAGELAHRRRQIEAKKRRMKGAAESIAEQIRGTTLELGLRVGSSGKVFGSIGTKDIAEKLTAAGFAIDRRRVVLAEPIKKLGTHFVKVKLHADVECQVKVNIEQIAASKEEEEAEAEKLKVSLEAQAAERDEAAAEEEKSE